MPRQSISFTKPNDEWLKTQVENEAYSGKSEMINDLTVNRGTLKSKTKYYPKAE